MRMKRNVRAKNGKPVVVMLVTLFLAIAPLFVLPTCAASTIISIDDAFMEAGENAVTQIMINNVSHLGVADITLTFNPSVVHIVSANNSDFDWFWPVINNSAGTVRMGGMDFGDGLYGNIKLAEVKLNGVGEHGEKSALKISINELKEAGPVEISIPATVDNGTAFINLPPVALARSMHRYNNVGSKYPSNATFNASASYDPDNDDITNYNWSFGDGYSGEGITTEHIYLTWKWNWTTNSYEPFNVILMVEDTGGLISTAIIPVEVYIAGDANGDGRVNILDAAYVGSEWSEECGTCGNYCWEGHDRTDRADLNNDCNINILDAMIIGANWGHTAW